ncbi:MAG: hypothetical protein HYZ44_07090 [Bacteroidetes bacterium]|nr:hypothetical protein [Bacteroidota bacterium]
MLTTFEIIDNYGIKTADHFFDLHNNYVFVSMEQLNETDEIVVLFKKSDGEWAARETVKEIRLKHRGVSYLNVQEKDADAAPEDETCLSDITFFAREDRDTNDSLLIQTTPNVTDDILYFFQSGQLIRIGCESIELTYN